NYFPKEMNLLKEQYGIQDGEKVLIHISNFRKVKRVQDIIYTFQRVRKQMKSKLLLIGDGPEYTNMVHLASRLNLKEDILFLGKQKNISDLLAISDLKLLMSEKESFGLVLLEAMSCGVPCIGTNVGGIPEVIRDGETGFLVDVQDTKTAAKLAVELLMDEEKEEQFRTNALQHVQEHFHSDKIVKQYEDLYENLIQQS